MLGKVTSDNRAATALRVMLYRPSKHTSVTYTGQARALAVTLGDMPKRILIVDDSAATRRLVQTFLESGAGLEVCGEAADGVEAIEKTSELKPDLIVLDLFMPRMNGLETASMLRLIAPNAPIIMLTFFKDALSGSQARDAGVASVLSKTDRLSLVVEETQRLLGVS
jgi:two-component system chemotaxis response regulator CheY